MRAECVLRHAGAESGRQRVLRAQQLKIAGRIESENPLLRYENYCQLALRQEVQYVSKA